MGKAAAQLSVCHPRQWSTARGRPQWSNAQPLSPVTVGGIPSLHEVPFDPTILTVPSIRDEGSQISKHVFRDELSKL